MIKLKNICKDFISNGIIIKALCGVTFEIQKGEFVSVMGESGCGKSTLIFIIGLIESADKGIYLFDGNDTKNLIEKEKHNIRKDKIGYITQQNHLIDELTVFENIELSLIGKNYSKTERKDIVENLLDKFSLTLKKSSFPFNLSGGERQKVAIARAIAPNPKLILADEPTNKLDPKSAEIVINMLLKLNEHGTSILLVTHSRDFASVGHKVERMYKGEIIAEEIRRSL